jgi:ribosomal-protein-alanine acetyltransferase
MAELLSKGEAPLVAGALPRPLYLVPPDAVLPSRRGRLPGGLRFERLEPPALSELVELEHACFEDPWSPELLAEELAPREDRLALGARDEEGTLVAAGLARLGRDDMSILSVATRPSSRRRGLGRALVRALLEEARRRDLARVDLEVRTTNRPAILLYASEGFVPVGRRPRYYRDGTDALLFSLLLRRGAQGGS